MKNILKNWKTTSAGIIMCVGAMVTYFNDKTQLMPCLTAFLGGVGLVFSKDGDQTGLTQ
jgi:hypothetical protein